MCTTRPGCVYQRQRFRQCDSLMLVSRRRPSMLRRMARKQATGVMPVRCTRHSTTMLASAMPAVHHVQWNSQMQIGKIARASRGPILGASPVSLQRISITIHPSGCQKWDQWMCSRSPLCPQAWAVRCFPLEPLPVVGADACTNPQYLS